MTSRNAGACREHSVRTLEGRTGSIQVAEQPHARSLRRRGGTIRAAGLAGLAGILAVGCAQTAAGPVSGGGRTRPAGDTTPERRTDRGSSESRRQAAPALPPLVIQVIPAAPRGADRRCLRALEKLRVPFVSLGEVRGVRTPVVVSGPIRGVRLLPRAGRAPLMDCELARALATMAPTLRKLKVTGLSFSGAYDYRTRRDSSKLSAHAFGLAIDVHALQTTSGPVDVARDYARNRQRWRDLDDEDPRSLRRCIGGADRRAGRLLRSLACRFKLNDGFRVVLTPDDNADHRDHLHIEAFPPTPRPGAAPRLSGAIAARALPRKG
jgi:hypothetical protein